MRRDPMEPPPCPVCDEPMSRNHHLPEQLGPWECQDCALFCQGTHAEWERYEPHRLRRRQLREERQ